MEMAKIFDDLKNFLPSIEKFRNRDLSQKEIETLFRIHSYYKNPIFRAGKDILRKKYLEKRNSLSEKFINSYSKEITEKFINSKFFKEFTNFFVYISYGSEFSTSFIIEELFRKGKRVFVPVVKEKLMLISEITEKTKYKTGKFGIKEPVEICEIDKKIIDIAIVPGIVYNCLGYRIGYGGGYYDRFLKDFCGISISFPFIDFIDNEFIPDYYDIPVDYMFF